MENPKTGILISLFLTGLLSCNRNISDGYYAPSNLRSITLVKKDSIFIFSRGFMSSGYDTYFGKRDKDMNLKKVKLNLYGYNRTIDSLEHTDSISFLPIRFLSNDSFTCIFRLYDKSHDPWPYSKWNVALYKNKKLIRKAITDLDGYLIISISKKDGAKYKLVYAGRHPPIDMTDCKDKNVRVFIAPLRDEDINYRKEHIKCRIKATRKQEAIMVDGVRYEKVIDSIVEKAMLQSVPIPPLWR